MTTAPKAFLIGHPVAHSRSPMLHGHWLQTLGLPGSYEKIDVAPEKLAEFFSSFDEAGWAGGNVTVPHKVDVIPFLDRITEAAEAMGAVNTIWREGDQLVGSNTDASGFMGNLDDLAPGWEASSKKALIIGAGGAARAAAYGLKERGLSVDLCNRTAAKAEELAAHFGDTGGHGLDALPALMREADLLVNTTSLGMSGKPPLKIDLSPLKPGAIVYDVVYVPLETDILKDAAARGHRTVTGLGMLLHQAVEGFGHWFGQTPQVTEELRALLIADIRKESPA